MKSWKTPTPDQVNRAVALLLHAEQVRYFFDRLQNPAWVRPLAKKGFFSAVPAPVVDPSDGAIQFPPWPASKYLARVASAAPEDVLEVAMALPSSDNVSVQADVWDIAKNLPPPSAAALTRRAIRAIQSGDEIHSMIEHRLEELFGHLLRGSEHEVAAQLLRAVLAVRPSNSERAAPRARLSVWSYDQFVRNNFDEMVQADPKRFFEAFIVTLRAAVSSAMSAEERHSQEDHSWVWRDTIEDSSGHVDDVRDILIGAVRDLALSLCADEPTVRAVVDRLSKEPLPIFSRIALHVLRERRAVAGGLVAEQLLRRELMEGRSIRREYARLLGDAFSQLAASDQQTILTRIDEGPGRRAVATGQEDDPAVAGERDLFLKEYWQLQQLAPIAGALSSEWKLRYEALVAKHGAPDDPRERRAVDVWSGPTSPFSVEDFKGLDVGEIVEKLTAWIPPPGFMVPTPEGVGRQLAAIVATEPHRFADTRPLQDLEPTYVRAVLDGFQQAANSGRVPPWNGALALASWVVAQPPGAERGDALDRDIGWGWSRLSIARLLDTALEKESIPLELRETVWQLLAALVEDADPTPEHEAERIGQGADATELSINATRSVALEAAIRYGLWVRDAAKEASSGDTGLAPELRRVLEEHLVSGVEPSLAVRSVYGRWFRALRFLDEQWTSEHVVSVFGEADRTEDRLGAAAWDAFVVWSNVTAHDYAMLRDHYRRAAAHAGAGGTTPQRLRRPHERLAQHLATLYWHGAVALSDSSTPLSVFFEAAPPLLRGKLIEFVGRSLYAMKESLQADVAQRLRALWEARCAGMVDLTAVDRAPEIAPFGWWVAAGNLGDEWILGQLEVALERGGQVEASQYVIERLATLAPQYPKATLRCFELMLRADKVGWRVESWREPASKILTTALRTPTTERAARDLINGLGQRGFHAYRGLLDAAADAGPVAGDT